MGYLLNKQRRHINLLNFIYKVYKYIDNEKNTIYHY